MRTAMYRACQALFALLLCFSPRVQAQVDAACDADGDGVVDDYSQSTWNEALQQANMLNFFGVSLAYSPLQSPAALRPFELGARLELSYIPALDCLERSVFNGQKTENTNKSPVLPRPRAVFGLPLGFYVGVTGVPPVELFGVRSGVIGGELGFGRVIDGRLELGLRATAVGARIVGDLAGPFTGQEDEPDIYRASIYAIEGGAGYRIARPKYSIVPYGGIGFTRVIALMYVGESLPEDYDETDPNEASVPTAGNDDIADALYKGLHLQLGAQARVKRVDLSIEAVVVPLGFRTFFSPRVAVGYRFF